MRPYHADDLVTLYHGNALEVLPAVGVTPDAVVTDPPYGETVAAWDRWPAGWVKAVGEVLPASASLWCFGSARMFLNHIDEFAGWRYAQEALWVKRNGSGPTSRDRLVKLHEWAYHCTGVGGPTFTTSGNANSSPRSTTALCVRRHGLQSTSALAARTHGPMTAPASPAPSHT